MRPNALEELELSRRIRLQSVECFSRHLSTDVECFEKQANQRGIDRQISAANGGQQIFQGMSELCDGFEAQ